ncbi:MULTISPECIES: hypothetical protein [unclassified Dehalobacter]|jgi:hypothetical protein|uniref:hypothetical protein n=1 Tax=unclassified Dehalobacter TaxID=2635733 RepID=UPI00039B63B8|nr:MULTISPECIES: hypothetical protein [unclassified Dehalobacter]RJE47660.1 hypothetical protein A7K50_03160 [Dehalobacter sp. MCB1]TCX53846.1 hypothetical protein C1I36_03690 [Dehalobacter sp. 14DCB1]
MKKLIAECHHSHFKKLVYGDIGIDNRILFLYVDENKYSDRYRLTIWIGENVKRIYVEENYKKAGFIEITKDNIFVFNNTDKIIKNILLIISKVLYCDGKWRMIDELPIQIKFTSSNTSKKDNDVDDINKVCSSCIKNYICHDSNRHKPKKACQNYIKGLAIERDFSQYDSRF